MRATSQVSEDAGIASLHTHLATQRIQGAKGCGQLWLCQALVEKPRPNPLAQLLRPISSILLSTATRGSATSISTLREPSAKRAHPQLSLLEVIKPSESSTAPHRPKLSAGALPPSLLPLIFPPPLLGSIISCTSSQQAVQSSPHAEGLQRPAVIVRWYSAGELQHHPDA